jgi:hypothetical protein
MGVIGSFLGLCIFFYALSRDDSKPSGGSGLMGKAGRAVGKNLISRLLK